MPLCLLPVAKGTPIVVDKTIVLVGRHPDCDVVLSHSLKVSRKHCCLVQCGAQHVVRDLGSLNGVWVNNERVERQEEMEIGDEVMIGDVVFVVQEVRGSRNEAKEASDDSADESGIRETPLQALPSDKISDDFLLPVDPDPNDSDDILPLVD